MAGSIHSRPASSTTCRSQSLRRPPSPASRRSCLLLACGLILDPRLAFGSELLMQLRRGSQVMLMRHARTEPGTGDPPGFRLDDCGTQRNLSEEGRSQARRIGARLREEGVPVDAVLTSAWCRCQETAELLDLGAVERLPALNSFFEDRARSAAHRAGMLEFIAGWRGPGNAVLVTHQVNITAVSAVFPASGEIVVMTSGSRPELSGRLRL